MKVQDKKDRDNKLSEMRRRFTTAKEWWQPVFDRARDDIRFVAVPGYQWDEKLKKRRAESGRPCYEFPKQRGQIQNIINEQKQSRPQVKIRGQQEDDQGLAEVMQGIYRNIESASNAALARDIAYESAVRGGIGFYRVTTDYANQDDFDLDIVVRPIRNFSGAYCDPAATELDRRDSLYWFVPESMHKDTFERRFPKADATSFYDDMECSAWRDADRIVVAEYWYKEADKYEIWSLSSGEVVKPKEQGLTEESLAAQGIKVTRRRAIEGHKVMSCLTNGHEFLTEPTEFPCKFIPIIPVFGNIDCIDGEDYISGAVAFGKDSQRLHNLHKTAIVESIAKAPKAPFIAKPKWIKGFEHMWKGANSEDYPVLYINDEAEETPQRSKQAEVPVALMQAAAMDNEDMKASNGQNDASLGARSNETSGIAIQRRQQQGNTASYNYLDRLNHAIQFEAEIIGDMIPRVIDTPRVVRTLGQDGGEKWVELYKQVKDEFGRDVTLNDISKGKYDYTVKTGPSYATQRMEMAEMFAAMVGQVGGAMPELSALLAYMAVKNTDTQDDEFQAASRKLMVSRGLLEPKEGEKPKEQPQPNPKDIASAEKDMATVGKTKAETESIELANMETATRMGVQMGEAGIAMPQQPARPPDVRSPSLPPVDQQPIQGFTGQA